MPASRQAETRARKQRQLRRKRARAVQNNAKKHAAGTGYFPVWNSRPFNSKAITRG